MQIRNSITLIGNLGADPKVRHLESGTTICELRLATNDTYRNRDGDRVTRTEWHTIKAYGKLAEVFEKHLRSGSKIAVAGTLRYDKWVDKHDQRRTSAYIQADEFTFLDGQPSTGSYASSDSRNGSVAAEPGQGRASAKQESAPAEATTAKASGSKASTKKTAPKSTAAKRKTTRKAKPAPQPVPVFEDDLPF